MKRLMEYTVFSGLVIIWFLAGWADQSFPLGGERDDGRSGPLAFRVLDDDGLSAFHDRDAGIRSSQVDSDDSTHILLL